MSFSHPSKKRLMAESEKCATNTLLAQGDLKEHKRVCKEVRNISEGNKETATQEEVGEEEVLVEEVQDELEPLGMTQKGGIEKIVNLKEWLKSPWTLMDEV